MVSAPDKKISAQRSALAIAKKLAEVGHPVSERQWTIDAKVSPSFFSNLRGTPTKDPSDPSVDQLRRVLAVRNVTLAEFFQSEARSRLIQAPTIQELEQALSDVWEGLPKDRNRRISFVAESVLRALGLPESAASIQDEGSNDATVARAE